MTPFATQTQAPTQPMKALATACCTLSLTPGATSLSSDKKYPHSFRSGNGVRTNSSPSYALLPTDPSPPDDTRCCLYPLAFFFLTIEPLVQIGSFACQGVSSPWVFLGGASHSQNHSGTLLKPSESNLVKHSLGMFWLHRTKRPRLQEHLVSTALGHRLYPGTCLCLFCPAFYSSFLDTLMLFSLCY